MTDDREDPQERYRLAAVDWAEKDGAARLLEEMRKSLLAELVNQSNETTLGKAEHWARDHRRYRDHLEKMVVARTAANIAKAKLDAMNMGFEMWRTKQATRRAEMNLR